MVERRREALPESDRPTRSHINSNAQPPSKQQVHGALILAVKKGQLEQAETILKENPDLVFSMSEWGIERETLLHTAVRERQKTMIELLLAKGLKVDAKSQFGGTPLMSAASAGNNEIVDLLLAKGADVNAKNITKRTPLHYAASAGRKDLVELFLAKGADINAAEEGGGETPLHDAAAWGRKEIAELLLAHGADVNAKSEGGPSALHAAAAKGHYQVVELLLTRGANVNAIMQALKVTPLHEAAANGHTDVVELLLANEANIDAKDCFSRTPLSKAEMNGHKDVIESLRQHAQKLDPSLTFPILPELRSAAILSEEAARKAENLVDSCSKRLGKDFNFATLFDYAARECNTGNYAVAAELFHRIYEQLKASSGNDETMVLSAFSCSYCACRAKGVWPISQECFPADLCPRYLEARGRFVATLILAHSNRNGIAKCIGGDSLHFEVRVRGTSVHSVKVQDNGDVVVVPATTDKEMQDIIERARRLQLTIPCMFLLVGSQSWW
jgi:ankyrin repeat protein